jgi:hypothetical protein
MCKSGMEEEWYTESPFWTEEAYKTDILVI